MIKKFVLRCVIFISCFIMIIFLAWHFITYNRADLCKTEANILFLGNSRIQYGVNDQLIPHSLNVGLNADNYVFSYLKLKLLKKYNPQIDTLILGYDKATLTHYFEISDEKFHPFFWDILDIDDWLFFLKHDKHIFMSPLSWLKILYPIKSHIGSIKFQELGIGGYTDLYRDKLPEAIQQYKKSTTSIHIDELQEIYLRKIKLFCSKNDIKLIFLNMPSHPITYDQSEEEFLEQYTLSHYSDIPYWDYEFVQLPDSCYGDLTHINYKGAKIISTNLKCKINYKLD